MSDKTSTRLARMAVALSLALSFSAARAANLTDSDTSLADSVKAALHHRLDSTGRPIRVQVIDGTIYLYGTVDSYAQKVSIEEATNGVAQGHEVVDSIEFTPS